MYTRIACLWKWVFCGYGCCGCCVVESAGTRTSLCLPCFENVVESIGVVGVAGVVCRTSTFGLILVNICQLDSARQNAWSTSCGLIELYFANSLIRHVLRSRLFSCSTQTQGIFLWAPSCTTFSMNLGSPDWIGCTKPDNRVRACNRRDLITFQDTPCWSVRVINVHSKLHIWIV